MELQRALIKEFKSVYVDTKKTLLIEPALNGIQRALRHGVLFNTDCFRGMTEHEILSVVNAAISEYGVNENKVNSTFYKRFSDVKNRSELELRIDQLLHYMSTYGSGYTGTEIVYEPEFLKGVDMDVKHQLVYITTITKEELADKVKSML